MAVLNGTKGAGKGKGDGKKGDGKKGKPTKKGKGAPAEVEALQKEVHRLKSQQGNKWCSKYLSAGGCPKGDACPFAHLDESAATEAKRANKANKAAAAAKAKAKATGKAKAEPKSGQ